VHKNEAGIGLRHAKFFTNNVKNFSTVMGKSLPPLGNRFACAQRKLSSSTFVTSLWTFLTPFGQSPSPYPYQGNPP
jgi:hypothetical protein